MTTVWKKAEEAVEVGADNGDILAPLKRVMQKYMKRAEKHQHAGRLECAAYCYEQGANVMALINQ
jgi:hypothetical protein